MNVMNLFEFIQNGLEMYSIPQNVLEMISDLREHFIEMEDHQQILQKEIVALHKDNLRLICENRDMETAIIAHIERDISHMKSLVKHINTPVIETLEEMS